jgi:agmatinase
MPSKPMLQKGIPFLGAQDNENTRLVLFGCPFDGTVTFRPGTRFGPAAIRAVSDVLETYDPVLKMDLEDVSFSDVGDLVLPPGDVHASLDEIHKMSVLACESRKIPAALGGEHLISLPVIQAIYTKYPDLVIVHFDAHMDMRDNYLGVKLSHATVMRRVTEFIRPSHILHVGQRSGVREEFEAAKELGTLRSANVTATEIRDWVGDRPVYVTVDLDVLDPSVFPGTGTPEPGGVSFNDLQGWLGGLAGCRWVGWDAVELSPGHDPTQISSIAAAKIVRTMILASTADLVQAPD